MQCNANAGRERESRKSETRGRVRRDGVVCVGAPELKRGAGSIASTRDS